jgi:opacity protein-like surface antigen
MKRLLVTCLLSLVSFAASANWETGRPYYDDGARITVSIRGGVAQPKSTMKNQLGSMPVYYYHVGDTVWINDPYCGDPDGALCPLYGRDDMGEMTVAKSYDSRAFAGGFSVGAVWGGKPNLRTELDWLHIAETSSMMNPLLKGEIETVIGTESSESLAARASTSTDVISAMIYYDFFKGMVKPAGAAVPYIGVGFGYASSKATLELTDALYELSELSLAGFGNTNGLIMDYFSSTTTSNNFSVSGAAGIAFGIQDGVFLDLGARATYVPEITWSLNNQPLVDGKTTYKERPFFSANDILFITVYAGLRFEF